MAKQNFDWPAQAAQFKAAVAALAEPFDVVYNLSQGQATLYTGAELAARQAEQAQEGGGE